MTSTGLIAAPPRNVKYLANHLCHSSSFLK